MRWTVRRKIVTSVAIIVLLGGTALVIVYEALTTVHTNLRELDERQRPTLQAAYEMEVNLVELAAQVLYYLESPDSRDLERIAGDRKDFERYHADYMRLADSARARLLAARVKRLYDAFTATADEMIADRNAAAGHFTDSRTVPALHEQIRHAGRRFAVLRREIDDVLDDEIQRLALDSVTQPVVEADTAVTAVAHRAAVLLPLFLFSACAVAGLLMMSLTRPMARLMAGTDAVRRGDLTARIPVKGSDELADLALLFNQMVERLEVTTVSKAALEHSESQLRATNDALRQQIANRERAEAAERSLRAELHRSEMLAAMGALVAGVAHEARNPLFALSATLEALEARLTRQGTRAAYTDHLAVLRREISRLTLLTRDLLEYRKPFALQLAPTPVHAVVDIAIEACRTHAEQAGVSILREVAADVECMALDTARMEQVFQNLIENAIQHSPFGGCVRVDVRRAEGERGMICEIVDQGSGIDTADLPRVFEPFFTRRDLGIGLGLSIVKRIVEQHGGRVSARNGAQGGVTFSVRLPIVMSPGVDAKGEQRAGQSAHC